MFLTAKKWQLEWENSPESTFAQTMVCVGAESNFMNEMLLGEKEILRSVLNAVRLSTHQVFIFRVRLKESQWDSERKRSFYCIELFEALGVVCKWCPQFFLLKFFKIFLPHYLKIWNFITKIILVKLWKNFLMWLNFCTTP